MTTNAKVQDYAAAVRESLEALEEKLAVAGYRSRRTSSTWIAVGCLSDSSSDASVVIKRKPLRLHRLIP